VNSSTTGGGSRCIHAWWESDIRNWYPTNKGCDTVRTRLAVTVYELPAVLDPSVHDVFCRVERGEPPIGRWSVLGTVYDDLGIVRCNRDSSGGNDQDSKPAELSKRSLHTGQPLSSGREIFPAAAAKPITGNTPTPPSPSLPQLRPSAKQETGMRIPPEIVDRIIDYVHDDVKTLTACSLIARDWVPSTRLHLFAKLSLLSEDEVARFTELDNFAPNILYYCQELTIGTNNKFDYPSAPPLLPFVGTPPSTIGERINRLTSLHTLHLRGFPSGVRSNLIPTLVVISEKITTITFTDSSLESCYDLWKILRLFPNLEHVHVSNLGYSSNRKKGLVISPGCCHSPPIISFSFHTHCQGFILEQLATPPYPLTHLKSLEIHHTDQQQQHLNSIATKYQNVITTLKFSACSTLGSGARPRSPPSVTP